jgi:glutathione S-transferase
MVDTSSRCPGCGVVLEATDWPMERRANASPACWHLYTQVLSYEMVHLTSLGRYHQLTVDAYGAQHADVPSRPISTAFGLIGLYLALEHGWSGTAVRAAHQFLAQRFSRWPSFRGRAEGPVLTVADVAGATTPDEHASHVQAWARSVWNSWAPEHPHVRSWAEAVLSPEVRDRLRLA